jgi:hypothetical protein
MNEVSFMLDPSRTKSKCLVNLPGQYFLIRNAAISTENQAALHYSQRALLTPIISYLSYMGFTFHASRYNFRTDAQASQDTERTESGWKSRSEGILPVTGWVQTHRQRMGLGMRATDRI